MQTFLSELATHLYKKYGTEIQHQTLFFPNNRAGLFFMKHLGELIDKPLWAPSVTTIKDYVLTLSHMQVADKLTLIFDLFEIFKKHTQTQEDFDRFYFWGEMLLHDFDEVDKYMANASHIFRNLSAEKIIKEQFSPLTDEQIEFLEEFWASIKPAGTSREQRDFIQLWEALEHIYTDFRELLRERGYGYEGLIYRDVVENLKSGKVKLPPQKLIVSGFNALNACEVELFKIMQAEGVAEFYWDADRYYIDNEAEAGKFMRENLKNFPMDEDFLLFDGFSNKEDKRFEIICVPQAVSQAKQVGNLLQEHQHHFSENHTAVILPDEQLLFPVLHSLPYSSNEVNVTMGYPMRNTPLYSLLEHLISLQLHIRPAANGSVLFYHRDVIALLHHPYLTKRRESTVQSIEKSIIEQNLIYISPDELTGKDELLSGLFQSLATTQNFFDYLTSLLRAIYHQFAETENEAEGTHKTVIEQEYIYEFYLHINRLREIVQTRGIQLEYRTLLRLMRQWLENTRIPFTGEPLKGLQVMGLLETRLLDFENVFILSMNEKIMPGTGGKGSFIPYHLRKAFNLPVIEHNTAINAYYFYRLIQRAKNVFLLYNVQAEDGSLGERSRYILQLKYEGLFKHFKEKTQPVEIRPQVPVAITVTKTAKEIALLDKYLTTSTEEYKASLSPTAINDYLSCRLRFYLKYLAEIKEAEEIEEELDGAAFGNIFHHTMEYLYAPYLNEELTGAQFDKLENEISGAIEKAFRTELRLREDKPLELEGRNIIIREVTEKYATKMIGQDRLWAPFTIKELEAGGVNWAKTISVHGKEVRLSGRIDRIDQKETTVRLLDYKTGGAERVFKGRIEDLFNREIDRNKTKAGYLLQTLFYGWIYKGSPLYIEGQALQPGLVVLKELFGADYDWKIAYQDMVPQKTNPDKLSAQKIPIEDCSPFLENFEMGLQSMLNEMFDPDIPFDQTPITEHCQYCPYIQMCHRD